MKKQLLTIVLAVNLTAGLLPDSAEAGSSSVTAAFSARQVLGEAWYRRAVSDYRNFSTQRQQAITAYRQVEGNLHRTGDRRLTVILAKIRNDIGYFERTMNQIRTMVNRKKVVTLVSNDNGRYNHLPQLRGVDWVADHLRRNPAIFSQAGTYFVAMPGSRTTGRPSTSRPSTNRSSTGRGGATPRTSRPTPNAPGWGGLIGPVKPVKGRIGGSIYGLGG